MIKRRSFFASVVCAIFFFVLHVSTSYAADADRDLSLEILNRWTCIRWGEENLAWVVYYPESLVEPWVRAEGERRRLRRDQIEAFRAAFIDELRIDSTTPILFSIQVYSSTPVDLRPIADNVWLLDRSGRKIRPIVVEKSLDGPLQGMAQGLIFFPKQNTEDFSVVIRGLVPERETIFSFEGSGAPASAIETTAKASDSTIIAPTEDDEIIVRIPTPEKKNETPARIIETEPEVEFMDEGGTYQPTVPPREIEPIGPPEPEEPEPVQADEPKQTPIRRAALSPRQALDIYIKSWMAGNVDEMYEMLSSGSRDRISRELFEKEVMSSFRRSLREGYKVSWEDENTAKITVARKFLLIRSLESKLIRFVNEDGTARVSW